MAPHHPKNKLFYSPKDSFPTILDYLTLSPQATGDILRSLETHPDRNAEAKRNAIQVSFVRPPLLPLDGTPGFAIASNYTTAITDFMVQQSGDIGRDIINEQKKSFCKAFLFWITFW